MAKLRFVNFQNSCFLQLPYKLQEEVFQAFRKEMMIEIILNMLENLKYTVEVLRIEIGRGRGQ